MTSPTNRQWLLLVGMAVMAGAALGWSLRQIREERAVKEQPQPVLPQVQLRPHPAPEPQFEARPLRQWPAPADREITETEAGISFTL